jgi:hypothetical protein
MAGLDRSAERADRVVRSPARSVRRPTSWGGQASELSPPGPHSSPKNPNFRFRDSLRGSGECSWRFGCCVVRLGRGVTRGGPPNSTISKRARELTAPVASRVSRRRGSHVDVLLRTTSTDAPTFRAPRPSSSRRDAVFLSSISVVTSGMPRAASTPKPRESSARATPRRR